MVVWLDQDGLFRSAEVLRAVGEGFSLRCPVKPARPVARLAGKKNALCQALVEQFGTTIRHAQIIAAETDDQIGIRQLVIDEVEIPQCAGRLQDG